MTDTQAAAAPATGSGNGPRREVLIVLPGLLLAIIIAMLDQLVVSTALPRIVGDLGGLSKLAWVVTAYILTSTIATPLYGKLGDLYGRKRLLMIAIVIFLIGSALSGLSHSIDQLIAFRALQGIGAGGLMVGALATIGDMVSPRERGQYMGYMMAAMMLAMIAGPLVGGYLTDTVGWRWIFYINMPVGGAALIYLAATLHLPRKIVQHKIDYLGAAVLAVAATAIVLLTTWAGTQYAWGSSRIIGLAVIAVIAIGVFLAVEARAQEPVLPLHVFTNRNFSLATGMSFLTGVAMLGAMTFLPLYQQTIQHASPTTSGLLLIPLMLGSTVTSLISGQVTSKTGRYKALPIIGSATMAVALFLLTRLGPDTSRLVSAAYYVVLGVGMGFLMQILSLIVQNSVDPRDMGVATSSRTFFQQIGGSIGVSVFGAIFIHRLDAAMSARLPGLHLHASSAQLDPATINSLMPAVRDAAFFGISHAIDGVFWFALPSAVLLFVLAVCIKEIPLRGRSDTSSEPPSSEPPSSEPSSSEPTAPSPELVR